MSANNDLMFDGRNRVAVVTGVSRGIGRGIVWELAARGFSVVVNLRSDAASARECCRQAEALGAARAMEFQADVADFHITPAAKKSYTNPEARARDPVRFPRWRVG